MACCISTLKQIHPIRRSNLKQFYDEVVKPRGVKELSKIISEIQPARTNSWANCCVWYEMISYELDSGLNPLETWPAPPIKINKLPDSFVNLFESKSYDDL
ncbi:hypothetical protein NPIL_302391 [Nephila pilipes]|uniref:Uncharacterized protein n=1 Tax=Nephila pilipes TaxID=299642 RepID=A0A8X6QPX5_NEPPI|nr:hypothetical protein NPIL_302391 [Nephila pilipes]